MNTPPEQWLLAPLLMALKANNGSDLHVKSGVVAKLRINGGLCNLQMEPWDENKVRESILQVMPPLVHTKFLDDMHEIDFAVSLDGVRFRACAFHSLGVPGIIFRIVPRQALTIDELNLPDGIAAFAHENRGLVLVTGPTGSGKSTTLSSLVHLINSQRTVHIVTLEDPVEIVHTDIRATITQREIGVDTASFADAVRSAMRQDPDVVLIGEMRDAETARAALSAAETGHLVLSTMHTSDAQETVNRFIDLFPADERAHIRTALAANLKGVVAQRLLPHVSGNGLVPCCEILVNSERVAGAIADPKSSRQIAEMISKDKFHGMRSFEQSLVELVREEKITTEVAMSSATNPNDLKLLLYSEGFNTPESATASR